jgi:hypothetical protein
MAFNSSSVLASAVLLGAAALLAGCSDDETGATGGQGGAAACAAPGGAVSGAKDAHCGAKAQPTTEASCKPSEGGAGGMGTGGQAQAGGAGGGGEEEEEYPDPEFNNEGDDDDCKYHVTWSSTAICENSDITFTVKATKKADAEAPLAGGSVDIEAFLTETHPAASVGEGSETATAGTYAIGPVRFDKPGKWTVRFHFDEECSDEPEDSPHSHVAFWVNVP